MFVSTGLSILKYLFLKYGLFSFRCARSALSYHLLKEPSTRINRARVMPLFSDRVDSSEFNFLDAKILGISRSGCRFGRRKETWRHIASDLDGFQNGPLSKKNLFWSFNLDWPGLKNSLLFNLNLKSYKRKLRIGCNLITYSRY